MCLKYFDIYLDKILSKIRTICLLFISRIRYSISCKTVSLSVTETRFIFNSVDMYFLIISVTCQKTESTLITYNGFIHLPIWTGENKRELDKYVILRTELYVSAHRQHRLKSDMKFYETIHQYTYIFTT